MPQAPAVTGGDAVTQARKAELEKAEAALKAAEAKPEARIIDPTAPSTVVALKTTDSRALRRQLDDIAADVVSYQCEVVFQVPRTEDAPWLKTLLEKRVRKIDSGFELKQKHQIQRSLLSTGGAGPASAVNASRVNPLLHQEGVYPRKGLVRQEQLQPPPPAPTPGGLLPL